MRSLVLVGHGSHAGSAAANVVHHCADVLRAQGQFGEVITAFWKEEPSLRQILKTVQFTDVTVIPMLLYGNHLSQTIIPRELGLGYQGPVGEQGVTRVLSGLSVHYTRPYGTHPATQHVIAARTHEALGHAPSAHTALYLVGHADSERNSAALEDVLQAHAAALRATYAFGEVRVLVLSPTADQPAPTATATVTAPAVAVIHEAVIVPFMDDVPPEGLPQLGEQLQSHLPPAVQVYVAQPVGTHPDMARVAAHIAQEARTPLGGDLERTYYERWQALSALCTPAHPLRLGEALLSTHSELLELRHALDEGRSNDSLTTLVTLAGLREHIHQDESGQYRPLSTLRTLPRGWRAVFLRRNLPQMIQALYPGVIEESYAHHFHALRATPWAATAHRQTGRLAGVQQASPLQVEYVASKLCGSCLKTRLWAGQTLHQTCFTGVPGALPCAEACSLLVSAVCHSLEQSPNT